MKDERGQGPSGAGWKYIEVRAGTGWVVNTPPKDNKVDRGKDRDLEEQAVTAQRDKRGWMKRVSRTEGEKRTTGGRSHQATMVPTPS